MAGGVAMYAGLAVALVARTSIGRLDPDTAGALGIVWIVVVAGSLAGWWLLRRRALAFVTEAARARTRAEPSPGPERMLALLIVGWALLEGAALFGITVYLLTGAGLPLAGGVGVMAVGMAASFPREEWFATFGGADTTAT